MHGRRITAKGTGAGEVTYKMKDTGNGLDA